MKENTKQVCGEAKLAHKKVELTGKSILSENLTRTSSISRSKKIKNTNFKNLKLNVEH